ncbi:hypothetical protein ACEPAF_6618 [Sanghuangporus sanghuang]
MVAFSRWQLAAALLEYDNDTENPNAPRRNAYDSAIFVPLRKANTNIHDLKQPPPPQSPNLLGVKLPSESGLTSEAGRDTRRRSKSSVDLLHNPFGEDEEEEQEEEDLEVDLASWGLDSLMPDEKPSKKSRGGKGKAKSDVPANTVGVGRRPGADRPAHGRTMSMPLAEFGECGAFLDSEPSGRRNTISDPVNLAELGLVGKPGERQRFSPHPIIENLPVRPPLHSLSSYERGRDTVPFPTSGPSEVNAPGDSRPASRLNLLSEDEANPFSIPPPPPSRASRFDPKSVAHARTMSNTTRFSVGPQLDYNDENQAGYSHRAPSRASLLDSRTARDRRLSAASFGTRDMLDDDFQSAYGGEELPLRERRYSRLDLMRPKVLVMPSPLQTQSTAPEPVPKSTRTKDGFLDSTDGRPLPPGARASRMSMLVPSSVPVAANSFTPNPRLSLSASQLLFRNQLLVDGQRDVSYNDIDDGLERAKEDGEQIKIEVPEVPEVPAMPAQPLGPSLEEEVRRSRPPGKLFGRSLIDDLEARKQEMRGKQRLCRVFKGDQRPSMMDRGSLNRSNTLLDPSALNAGPTSSRMPSQPDTALARRGSRNSKPLLAIDDNGQIAETSDAREMRMTQTKSVFGVDTLWEREMAKLKEIEAQEKIEQEQRNREIEEEERKWQEKEERKKSKKGKKKKGKDLSVELSPPSSMAVSSSVSPRKEAAPSLSLPDIPTVTSRKRIAPPPDDFDSDNESSASEAAGHQDAALQEGLADQWVSDDEKRPAPVPTVELDKPCINLSFDDDSDEDVPLSVTLQRAAQKLNSPRSQPDDDSDEDRPLSMILLNKPSLASFKISSPSSGEPENKVFENGKSPSSLVPDDDDDDDNVPLGVRTSRIPAGASQVSGLSGLSGLSITGGKNNNEDDDDRPLSMHPAQIRKSQFQMLAQVQQQQQMLQAQMTNSMMFSHPPSMMFMMPPAAAQPPILPQAQPPIQDANKFSSVDKWRHHVAVEQS